MNSDRKMMRLPKNSMYPGYSEVHPKDDWCEKVGCTPVCPLPVQSNSCNRHVDCDAAEAEVLKRNPGKTKADISLSFHCHQEDCEDCFGN